MASAHKVHVTALMNKHFKEQQSWVQQANRYFHEEADMQFLCAEQIHNLTNEICAHCPDTAATDIPIKQEQV